MGEGGKEGGLWCRVGAVVALGRRGEAAPLVGTVPALCPLPLCRLILAQAKRYAAAAE